MYGPLDQTWNDSITTTTIVTEYRVGEYRIVYIPVAIVGYVFLKFSISLLMQQLNASFAARYLCSKPWIMFFRLTMIGSNSLAMIFLVSSLSGSISLSGTISLSL